MQYKEFLQSKNKKQGNSGRDIHADLVNSMLFEWQRDITLWAVKKGRCAVLLDTGLGKTFIQLEWARLLGKQTLIIAPLSVARQTVREAKRIGISVEYVRSQNEVKAGNKLWITNYEMISEFDFAEFGAVVLDESSILKSISGQTKRKLINLCKDIPYRLCCTATPAPNDYTEIGNHAEFLGICSTNEMLSTFFINANKEHLNQFGAHEYRSKGSNKGGTEWRLKHHAESHFFEWLASWAITMEKPSDIGYSDDGFILPELRIHPIFVDTEYSGDQLFFTNLHGISDRVKMRKETTDARLNELKACVNGNGEQWIIWAGLDKESSGAKALFPDATEVKGTDSPEYKAQAFEDFQDGKYPILVSKTKIGGFGMNFQNSHKMVFLGLSDSWESYYQAIRRQWRYGQHHPVDVYIIMSTNESEVYHNVMRKDALARVLRHKLIAQMKDHERRELGMDTEIHIDYSEDTVRDDMWTAMKGDSCERLKELGESSIDLSVYSPPFADLYTYTASDRDLGNSKGWDEFFGHYAFVIREVLRVTKPGRLTCVHTSDIPALAQKDGYIGVRDFPGEVIRAYEREGWIFTGRAFVQKNPQSQAIRTKSKALLFVQLRRDAADSRPALIDQILLFKKPGDNAIPIKPVANGELDNETWIEWAHGIWLNIRETKTLQFHKARGDDDEKHICPLQLGTIERCVKLYSNPGETVLTPFGGIGSEAYVSLDIGRKAVLIELKPEYFNVAVKNMRKAVESNNAQDLFSISGVEV